MKTIQEDVLTVLSSCTVEASLVRLPPAQLDRKLYLRVNEVLEALGGKWSRKARGHVFEVDPADRLDVALSTGTFNRPADFGFFPTPPDVAEVVACRAEFEAGQSVLEPSAGTGALVTASLRWCSTLTFSCIEIQPELVSELRRKFPQFSVIEVDFLATEWLASSSFDRVVMNPPFARGQEIDHVRHALKFLRPGGLLVSVMSAGVEFRQDRRYADFRRDFSPSIERLPPASFRNSGTDVSTVIVVIKG